MGGRFFPVGIGLALVPRAWFLRTAKPEATFPPDGWALGVGCVMLAPSASTRSRTNAYRRPE